MNRTRIDIAILVMALLLGGCSASGEEGDYYEAKILGCLRPVPSQYVAEWKPESKAIELVDDSTAGRIWIEEFKGWPEETTVVSEQRHGDVMLSEVVRKSDPKKPAIPVTVVRSQGYSLTLSGAAKALLPSLLEPCPEEPDLDWSIEELMEYGGNYEKGAFYIKALGCKLPVPLNYALIGEPSEYGMEFFSENGRITVGYHTDPNDVLDRFTVLWKKKHGRLGVHEMFLTKTTRDPPVTLVTFHDQKQAVNLIGDAKELLPQLLEACEKDGS